jgi:GLPGLI family protein
MLIPNLHCCMKYSNVSLFLVLLVLTSSCSNTEKKDRITSGRIDYMITYLNDDLDNKTMELLPKKMRLVFNEKQAANNIEGFLGFYKLNAITDFHTRKCSTILKILDKHYMFKGRRDELMCCFDEMADMQINETQETKEIAGFTCKKSIVHIPSTGESFAIYYTDEIALRHPNSTNPYKKVNGVLMEFELNLLHLRMKFVAEKFHDLNMEGQFSKIPDNMKVISRDQMTQILNKLMEEQ